MSTGSIVQVCVFLCPFPENEGECPMKRRSVSDVLCVITLVITRFLLYPFS